MSAALDTRRPARSRRAHRAGSARERLLAAALARFDGEGVVAARLEDIRRDAGVSVGALYHHFPDKAALAGTLYAEVAAQFQEGFLAVLRSNPGAEDGVKDGVRFYLRWVSENRAGAALLLGGRPSEQRPLRERNRAFFAEATGWWETHAHYGAVRRLPFDLIEALWLGPAQEYTRHWAAGRAKRVPTAVADVLAQAAWQTLKEDR